MISHYLEIVYRSGKPFNFSVFGHLFLVTVSRLILGNDAKKLIELLLRDIQKVYFFYFCR